MFSHSKHTLLIFYLPPAGTFHAIAIFLIHGNEQPRATNQVCDSHTEKKWLGKKEGKIRTKQKLDTCNLRSVHTISAPPFFLTRSLSSHQCPCKRHYKSLWIPFPDNLQSSVSETPGKQGQETQEEASCVNGFRPSASDQARDMNGHCCCCRWETLMCYPPSTNTNLLPSLHPAPPLCPPPSPQKSPSYYG